MSTSARGVIIACNTEMYMCKEGLLTDVGAVHGKHIYTRWARVCTVSSKCKAHTKGMPRVRKPTLLADLSSAR